MMENMKNNIQNLTFTALMTAVLCIIGPFVVPVGMVPVSFANMAIYLTIILLDKKKAFVSIVIYLLIGFIGIPVFSGFSAGAGKLFGPTGGYLIGYLVLSFIGGKFLENEKGQRKKRSLSQFLALSVGTFGLYITGTAWLMYQSKLDAMTALTVGVFPFVLLDFIKMILAISLGNAIKKRLRFLL